MKRALVVYPHADPSKLYDGPEGQLWFGRELEGEKWDARISTGYSGVAAPCLLTLEPPAVQPHCFQRWYRDIHERVFSFAGPMREQDVTFRYPLPPLWPPLPSEVDRNPWEGRIDGVVAVMGNKGSTHPDELYSMRVRTVQALHESGIRVDVYGRPGFDGAPWYRGEAGDKRELLSRYRFCLCLENCSCPNYVSEKLPEALLAGCVPIYRGAPNLEDYPVPLSCIVDPADMFDAIREYTAEDHAALLDRIDPQAIAKALCPTSLYRSILSSVI